MTWFGISKVVGFLRKGLAIGIVFKDGTEIDGLIVKESFIDFAVLEKGKNVFLLRRVKTEKEWYLSELASPIEKIYRMS